MSLVMLFDAYGGPDVLYADDEDVADPGPGQVRIVQHAIGVNPADVKMLAGRFGADRPLPGVLGFEGAGVAEAVGPDVDGIPPGARVVWHGSGAQRETALVEASRVRLVPGSVDLDQAAVLPVAAATAFAAVVQAGVGTGGVVLVHGASGGVGSAAVQIATALGARVIGTASDGNRDYLRALGAVPLVYGPGLADRVRDLPDGLSDVSAVVDLVGTPETVAATVEILGGRPGVPLAADADRAVAVAVSPATQEAGIPAVVPHRGALAEALTLAEAGLLHTEISAAFPLERAADALRAMSGHARGKVVLHTAAMAED